MVITALSDIFCRTSGLPLQIHDELESVSAMVKETIELVMALDVPLKVNTEVWGSLDKEE